MTEKRVYTFGNGKAEGKADMRNLLGGKGANLAEMNLIGVPVPPGFTITTDVCNEYFEKGKESVVALFKRRRKSICTSYRNFDEQQIWRRRESSARQRTFRSTCFNAWYDGYNLEPRSKRQGC